MALEEEGLFEKGKCGEIKTSLWIKCLKNTDTAERIEANLGLTHGSFKKGRKEERRKKKEERRKKNFQVKITKKSKNA